MSIAIESNSWVLSMRLSWDNIGDNAVDDVGGVNCGNREGVTVGLEGAKENSDGGIIGKCVGR